MLLFTYTRSSASLLGEAALGEAVGSSCRHGRDLLAVQAAMLFGMSPAIAALIALHWEPENLSLVV